MRWALIQSGYVANVVEQDDQPQIAGQWVACGAAGPGWSYDGSDFAPPPVLSVFVATVSRRQALRALHDAGLLDDVEAIINGMSEPARTVARIDWDNATEFRRDNPLVAQLGAALGLTPAQVDDLFTVAAAIE